MTQENGKIQKIFLVGSSSLLASDFNKIYNNYEIFRFSRNYNENSKNYFPLNINTLEKFEDLILKHKPDLIFNFVAITDLEYCEKEIDQSLLINNIFSNKLVDMCSTYNLKYIYVSTDQVYYNNNCSEDIDLNLDQKSIYARHKRLSEIYIQTNLSNYLILRTNFFGYAKHKNNNFISHLLSQKPLKLFNDFNFKTMYKNDLLYAINELIKKSYKGIFNIACDELISKYDLGIKILNIMNISKTVIPIKTDSNFYNIRSSINLSTVKIREVCELPTLNESILNLEVNIK